MKKALLFLLCALMVLAFAACGEKEVSNDPVVSDNNSNNSEYSDSTFDEDVTTEDDEALLNIQDVIGFWNPTAIYQAPRATDSEFESDEDALVYAQGIPVQISANEFDSALYFTDNAVFKKVPTDLNSLGEYGIQVDETLEALVGDGQIIRLDIHEGEDDFASFQVFIINSTTMLYEGDGGYIFLASLEESVG